MADKRYNDLYVVLVAVTFVVFLVAVIITIFGIIGGSAALPIGLPFATVLVPGGSVFGDVSLPPWAWWFWLPVALWLLAIQIYNLISISRWRAVGYLYHSPRAHMPVTVHALFLANLLCFITWVFVVSWGYFDIGLGFLLLVCMSILALQYFTSVSLDDSIPDFTRQGRTSEIHVIRGLVHNGYALYDTFQGVFVYFGIGQILIGRVSVGVETAGTIVLVIAMFINLIWIIIDLLFLDRYARYLLTPYIVYPFAFIASLVNNEEWSVSGNSSRNASLTVVFLVLSCILLAVKIIVLANRHRRCPDAGRKCNPDGAESGGSSRVNISSIEEDPNNVANADAASNVASTTGGALNPGQMQFNINSAS